MPDLSQLTFKFVRVNATADGDNTVVAAVSGKKLRVIGYAISATAAGVATFQDTAGTPVVFASFPLAANGGVVYDGGPECPAFETASGAGIEINCATGQDITGHMTYLELEGRAQTL